MQAPIGTRSSEERGCGHMLQFETYLSHALYFYLKATVAELQTRCDMR